VFLQKNNDIHYTDALTDQLDEWFDIQHPAETSNATLRASYIQSLTGPTPERFGVYVFYPWSRQLVHLAPPAMFRSIRQNRNQYKITQREQQALQDKRIGIIGQSLGQSIAAVLAIEGIGSSFYLADPDTLNCSNTNRLEAATSSYGLNKSIISARRLFELDPFLDIHIFPEGITPDNIHAFLEPEGQPIDLLFEECDDFSTKVLARIEARSRNIPVVMCTDEREMLDIERFDIEPNRPILHGLLGDTTPSSLASLSDQEKTRLVLQVLGEEEITPQQIATLLDIGKNVIKYSQTGSEVALSSGLAAKAARHVLMNHSTRSGRYYIDVNRRISEENVIFTTPIPSEPPPSSLSPEQERARQFQTFALPKCTRQSPELSKQSIKTLVSYGITAPSGGNIQPWRFYYDGHLLHCGLDPARLDNVLEWEDNATLLALGAAVENIRLAASQMQLSTTIFAPHSRPTYLKTLSPHPYTKNTLTIPQHVCSLQFETTQSLPSEEESTLFQAIPKRVTNRRMPESFTPLIDRHREALRKSAIQNGTTLHLIEKQDEKETLGKIMGRAERIRFLNKCMHEELLGELRWTPEEAMQTRDGLDLDTLEFSALDKTIIKMLASWPAMNILKQVKGGQTFEESAQKSTKNASALGLLTIKGHDHDAFFQGGRSMQTLWLLATSLGLAFHPLASMNYMFARARYGDTSMFEQDERDELQSLWQMWSPHFSHNEDDAELLLFRLFYAPSPSYRSLRKHVDDVLEWV
tara:strand:+ start:760 stop:3015 length:2256 start_codon:yes stop_codon:yes gene_type:complete